MDYAFAPDGTDYDKSMQQLFTNRPNTTLISVRGVNTISDFLNRLNTAPGITLPAGDLFIVSHGNDRAWMQIHLNKGQRIDTTYDVADAAVAGNPDPLNTGAIAGAIEIPTSVNHDSGGALTSMAVNFRGCRIGVSQPFVKKLKEAFGNDSPVTAPVHFHDIYQLVPSNETWEYLSYSFGIAREKRFAKTADLAAALDAENFTFLDGSAVPTTAWDAWLPKRLPGGGVHMDTKKVFLDLGRTLAGLKKIPDAIEFRHDVPRPYTFGVRGLAKLPPKAQQRDTLRQALNDDAANNPDSLFASSHPFPVFARWGKTDIDDFVDNLDWGFSWDKKRSAMLCSGTQHEYTVIVPITLPPDPPDLKTGKLVYNFFQPGGAGSVVELLTSDADKFFTA